VEQARQAERERLAAAARAKQAAEQERKLALAAQPTKEEQAAQQRLAREKAAEALRQARASVGPTAFTE